MEVGVHDIRSRFTPRFCVMYKIVHIDINVVVKLNLTILKLLYFTVFLTNLGVDYP